ncbi:sugar kinase [Coprinopsis cinerea okayama7|uniref:Ribokinase n=1 Tax=Coprinopsis cinerea (strain Okayama-7 / 130 / ATCC MYA-4618 / FGSC 9003) TaxID=240176 RepID=A8NCZ0_COPC7|nr:sugar kinase [Coprinopsis cinerea okayama7\|eukprot:XP_001832663.2 sugar kinase [Coprinopsis cinerea okayama7\
MTPNRPFGTSKCAVRGSIMDQIAKPGETKASKLHESRIGGKGANQAVAIARAGGLVQFYGTIGKDGVWIKEQLKEHGIDKPTGRAIIQVGDDGENSIILFPGANHSELHEQQKFSSGRPWFGNATHLLLQNEIHPRSTLHALHEAANMVTIFNPSPMPPADQIREFPWTKIDWLLVNEGEAEALLRILGPPPPLNIRPASISAMSTKDIVFCLASHPSFASTNIICTLGPDGVLAFVPEFHRPGTKHEAPSFMHLPPAKLEGDFRDTTGAGDCFTGYFVQGLMEFGPDARPGHHITERDLAMLLRKCNLAAGMSVEKPGTIDSIPSRAAVESRLAASYAGSPIITGMKGPSGV